MGTLNSIVCDFVDGGPGGVHLLVHEGTPDEAGLTRRILDAIGGPSAPLPLGDSAPVARPGAMTGFAVPRTPAYEPLRNALQACTVGESGRILGRFGFFCASVTALAQDFSEAVGAKNIAGLLGKKFLDSRKFSAAIPNVDLGSLKGDPRDSPLRDPESVLDTLVNVARSKTCEGKRLIISYWNAHKDRSNTVELLAELHTVADQHSTRREVYLQYLDRFLFLLHTTASSSSLPKNQWIVERMSDGEDSQCFVHRVGEGSVSAAPAPEPAVASSDGCASMDPQVSQTLRVWNAVFGSWQGVQPDLLGEILKAQGVDPQSVLDQLLASGVLTPGLEVDGVTLHDVAAPERIGLLADDDSPLDPKATAAFLEALERHGWLSEAFDLACDQHGMPARELRLGFRLLQDALKKGMPQEVRRLIDRLITHDLKRIPEERTAELQGLTGRMLVLKTEEIRVWDEEALDAAVAGIESLDLPELPPMSAYLGGSFAAFVCSMARHLETAGRTVALPQAVGDAEPLVLVNTRNRKVKLFPLALVPPRKGRGTKGQKVLPSGTANEIHVVYRTDSMIAWADSPNGAGLIRVPIKDMPVSADLYASAPSLTVPDGEAVSLHAVCPLGTGVAGFLVVAENGQAARLTTDHIPHDLGCVRPVRECQLHDSRVRWLLSFGPQTTIACGTTKGRLLLFLASDLEAWQPGQVKEICQLDKGERVAAVTCLHDREVALTVSAKGYGKKTEPSAAWRLKKPGQSPVNAMGASTDPMATIEAVPSLGGEVLIVSTSGRMLRIANEGVPIQKTIGSRGPRIIRVADDESVACATAWPIAEERQVVAGESNEVVATGSRELELGVEQIVEKGQVVRGEPNEVAATGSPELELGDEQIADKLVAAICASQSPLKKGDLVDLLGIDEPAWVRASKLARESGRIAVLGRRYATLEQAGAHVIDCLGAGAPLTHGQIVDATGLREESWSAVIDHLLGTGRLRKEGQGRGTRYAVSPPKGEDAIGPT